MVGDIVRCTTTGEIIKIARLNLGDVNLLTDEGLYEDDKGRVNFIYDLEPVALTEQIMLLNGFKWRSKPGSYALKLLDNDNHCLMSISYGKKIAVGGHEIDMKYVHELQHALRMCYLYDVADNFKLE